MKEVTERPKIDLAEIESLASHFRSGKDELFPSELLILAQALEALPKLVEALRHSERIFNAGEDADYPDLTLIAEALFPFFPFTTKTVEP